MRFTTKLLPCLFLLSACHTEIDENVLAEAYDDNAIGETASELSTNWVTQTLDVQSEHPYANGTDTAFDAFDGGMSGVRNFIFHFKKLDTEFGYDFVELYNEDAVRLARFSGKSNGFWTKTFAARKISFRFVSDKAKTKWGFQIDKAQVTGCTTNKSCGDETGWKCQAVQCKKSPCFNVCDFQGALCGTRGAKACEDPSKCMGGNPPADVPGECVPRDYCEYASDCTNLVLPRCWGSKWRCEENTCQWQCGVTEEQWNDCSSDSDCARGESCVDTGKRCITTPCYGVYQCKAQGQQAGETCGGIGNLQCAAGLDRLYGDVPGTENDCSVADRGGVCGTRPQACTQIYKPVCGCDGQTYGNACMLAAAGAAFSHDGACSLPLADAGQTCGGIAGIQCKAGLSCDYGAAGTRGEHDSKSESMCTIADRGGVCRKTMGVFCVQTYDPVCGCDGNTYGNDCTRATASAPFAYWGACQ